MNHAPGVGSLARPAVQRATTVLRTPPQEKDGDASVYLNGVQKAHSFFNQVDSIPSYSVNKSLVPYQERKLVQNDSMIALRKGFVLQVGQTSE